MNLNLELISSGRVHGRDERTSGTVNNGFPREESVIQSLRHYWVDIKFILTAIDWLACNICCDTLLCNSVVLRDALSA